MEKFTEKTKSCVFQVRKKASFLLSALLLIFFNLAYGNKSPLPAQQQVTISGKISDSNTGEPLAGANVVLMGGTQGTTADFDGNYSFTITSQDDAVQLEASYIGYATKVTSVNITGASVTVNFSLNQSAQALGAVVVTANKRGERLQDVPSSVQALTSETVEQIGIRDINEVLAFVPGASEDLSFGAGLRQYQLRGIPQGPGDPTIGYYVDDIPFNFFGFRWAPLGRTFDVSRVEVLRGPQSTLYGAGAMGGVIKFVTNKPNLYEFGGKAVAGLTTLADGDSGYYTDLALNVPIIKEKLAIRLTGSLEQIGGYADNNPELLQEDFAKNINEADISQFRAQLLYQPTENFQIRASYYRNENEQDGGTFLSELDPEILLGSKNDIARANWEVFSGTLQYDFSFATLTSTFSSINVESTVSTSLFLGDVFGTGEPLGLLTSFSDNNVKGFNHETRITSRGDGPFKWLGGFYFVESDATFDSFIVPELAFFPPSESLSQSVSPSFFGEVSYGFLDNKLVALAGLRTFRDRRTFTEDFISFTADGAVPVTDQQQNTFTSINPRLNLSYQPNENTNFYINAAKGFRGGQFNSNAVVAEHTAFGLPASNLIESDEIWSYEVGSKLSLAENQVSVELAAYRQNWSNAILQFAVVSFADYNVGDVLGQGIDLGVAYAPANTPWTFTATANLNSTEFDDIRPELLESIEVPSGVADPPTIEVQPLGFQNGDAYPFVPNFTFAASINYNKTFGTKGWGTNNTVSFSHRGEQPGNGDIVSDPLSLMRLRLGVTKDNFAITLFGNNLFNDRDSNYAQRTPALTAFTPTLPRQLGLEVSVGF
ncbi:TonB-dependent receptor [Croceitalea dokdonensis]|uniref:TonB-dependent receptor n=1 Tax=Croceitalea dokdonensis TaxID=346188 RepID=UPI00155DB8A3|nr:TonB-dependent receptor [Croceitalea dokdonensis]